MPPHSRASEHSPFYPQLALWATDMPPASPALKFLHFLRTVLADLAPEGIDSVCSEGGVLLPGLGRLGFAAGVRETDAMKVAQPFMAGNAGFAGCTLRHYRHRRRRSGTRFRA